MARRGRRMSSHDQRGAAAVEFAIILPILAALLLGIINLGLGYNKVLGLAEGVREGARFGATLSSPGWSGATVQQHTIDSTFLNVAGHPVVVDSTMVCAQLVRAPSTVVASSSCSLTTAAPLNPVGIPDGTCLVKVWAELPVKVSFVPPVPAVTVTVKRQSVSLYERGTC
jgi:Flp pilus assembly protein TadG